MLPVCRAITPTRWPRLLLELLMTRNQLLAGLPFVMMAAGCSDHVTAPAGGDVRIVVQQSLTGQTTSAGIFSMTGAVADEGATTEELVFGGPLTQSPVPVTFRRTLTGKSGTIIVTGSATLTFTSATVAVIAGTWEVQSATGALNKGHGRLDGSANFGATPPTGNITYTGSLTR